MLTSLLYSASTPKRSAAKKVKTSEVINVKVDAPDLDYVIKAIDGYKTSYVSTCIITFLFEELMHSEKSPARPMLFYSTHYWYQF